MLPEIDLLAIQRGSITAPAGCGKTQLIAEALASHSGNRPILVLTHTNAGVTALRTRLKRAGVPSSAYRLSTIDGFAMRLIAKFPARSGHHPQLLSSTTRVATTPRSVNHSGNSWTRGISLHPSQPLTPGFWLTSIRIAAPFSTPSCPPSLRFCPRASSVTLCRPSSDLAEIGWFTGNKTFNRPSQQRVAFEPLGAGKLQVMKSWASGCYPKGMLYGRLTH